MFHITYFCAHMKQKLTFWKMLCLEKKNNNYQIWWNEHHAL